MLLRKSKQGIILAENLTDLKKHIFYGLLDMAGRVFVVVRYSENVLIGERGFLPGEKEDGLVLVFNARMDFLWNEQGITATLGFGRKVEKCFIPSENIISVFSPELNAQFTVSPTAREEAQDNEVKKEGHSLSREKVVKIDFSRKK